MQQNTLFIQNCLIIHKIKNYDFFTMQQKIILKNKKCINKISLSTNAKLGYTF
jgi:hypothetical protein